MLRMKKQFCDLGPTCYKIAVQKEICKRKLKNLLSKETFSKQKSQDKLPAVIYSFRCNMIKRAPGVELSTQYNKADNIRLACAKMNGILIRPGETFSFWQLVGKISEKNGYKSGRVVTKEGLTTGIGGGLCNLGNSINRTVLHSPLTITEFHTHSDALAPDEGERIPLHTGTSVSYNYVDYRCKNNTDQTFQLLLWCDGDDLCTELRAENPVAQQYRLVEEDHHFRKKGNDYYSICKLYRIISDGETGAELQRELIWDNRSIVRYDHALIPAALIRE